MPPLTCVVQTVGVIALIPSHQQTPIRNLAPTKPIPASLRTGESPASRQLTAEVIVAAQVQKITMGVDVSKDKLDIYQSLTGQRWQIDNDSAAIAGWLSAFNQSLRIALEPTSTYHLALIRQAHRAGVAVYLVNPRQLAHYRFAVGERNKTDASDACLLARYLEHEGAALRELQPQCANAQRLWSLIKRRAGVVAMQQQLRQSFEGIMPIKASLASLRALTVRIDRHIARLIEQLGWTKHYQRCQTIPGIGPVNAAALVAAFHRGAFASADAFIAYLGLDVRIRESGRFRGKRKLTKNGEPELRRLLWCAAPPARSYHRFRAYHQAQLDKGLSKIAANVVLARKLARIAFALLRDRSTFKKETCPQP